MSDLTLTCPTCKASIPLTESLAAPIIAEKQEEYRRALEERDEEVSRIQADVAKREAQVKASAQQVELTVAAQLQSGLEALRSELMKSAREELGGDLQRRETRIEELGAELATKNLQLNSAQKTEAEYMRKQRLLDDDRRAMDIEIETRIASELGGVREQAHADARSEQALAIKDKDLVIADMRSQIEVMRQKAEQGSQQRQGDTQEIELLERLVGKFPLDDVRRVGKGEFGGDCVQTVMNAQGKECGTILWESKRTKIWSEGWLAKLRDDQHEAKADVAIIVSQVLPKGVETFELVGEIWVAGFDCVLPVAGALRHILIEIAATRRLSEGYQDKASLVYSYVTSLPFKQRVQALLEAYRTMEGDLRKEQTAMKSAWARREKQLEKMSDATAGMWGDLQGIAGKQVPELDGLSFDTLIPVEPDLL